MTLSDVIAVVVLLAFVALGVAGWLKWVFRAGLGLAVGVALLVGVGAADGVPGLKGTSAFLNEGAVTPGLTDQARVMAGAVGLDWRADRSDEPAPDVPPTDAEAEQRFRKGAAVLDELETRISAEPEESPYEP